MTSKKSIPGVQVREKSIRVKFSLDGVQIPKTLMLNNAPMSPTPANIKFAERLIVDIKTAIRLDRFRMSDFFAADGVTKTGRTVDDQLKEWLVIQRVTKSTMTGYKSCANFWCKTDCDLNGTILADLSVPALTTKHVKHAIASVPKLSGKSINNYLQVLREAMDQAKQDGLITVNPVIDPKTGESIRAAYQKPEADPFKPEEVERILASMKDKYPEQIVNFTEFWMFTGVRTAELYALKWGSIDFATAYFAVTETLVRGDHQDHTKTNKMRNVKLNSRALAALMRQKKHTFLAGESVFQDPRYDQGWIDERAFGRSFWKPTLKRLGIRYRRPYNCRHTYATQLIMANANHKWAAGQMGHSVEMFQKTYTKWIDGDQNELEIAKLEANLKNQISPGLVPETSKTA